MSFALKGTIKFKKDLERKIKAKEKEMTERMGKAIALNANRVRTEALKLLKTRTPGKTETRYGGAKGKRTVTVSRPGDAPNPDTKRALKSVKVEIDKKRLRGAIGTNLEYLAAIEFNSRKTKRLARPWLRPAFKKWYKQHGKHFEKDLK